MNTYFLGGAEKGRIQWLLRRGMRELDVVVTRYYERRFAAASEAERAVFVKLLETVEDPDLWAWIMGHQIPPAEYADVVAQLQRHD